VEASHRGIAPRRPAALRPPPSHDLDRSGHSDDLCGGLDSTVT
jgi:hypothetical protein